MDYTVRKIFLKIDTARAMKPPTDQRIVDDFFKLSTGMRTKSTAWLFGMVATYGVKPEQLQEFTWGPSDSILIEGRKSPVKPLKNQKPELSQRTPENQRLAKTKLNAPTQPSQTSTKKKGSLETNTQKLVNNKFPSQHQITSPSKPNKPLPPKPRQEVKPNITKPSSQPERKLPLSQSKIENKI